MTKEEWDIDTERQRAADSTLSFKWNGRTFRWGEEDRMFVHDSGSVRIEVVPVGGFWKARMVVESVADASTARALDSLAKFELSAPFP